MLSRSRRRDAAVPVVNRLRLPADLRPPGATLREVISPMGSLDRRAVLRSGLAAAALGAVGAATGCTPQPSSPAAPAGRRLIGPDSPQVGAAEAARRATGGTVMAGVAPEVGHVDLGGPVVATWSYGGQIPGPE